MQVPQPPNDARWQHLTPELLASDEGAEVRSLIATFVPLDNDAGRQMESWLGGVADGEPPFEETHIYRTDRELLGFFAGVPETVTVSFGLWPIIELRARIRDRRNPQPALLLAAIARNAKATEPLFGHHLFDYAVAIAKARGQVVLLVRPDNPEVATMWCERYGLVELEAGRSDLLYFPTSPAPPPQWP